MVSVMPEPTAPPPVNILLPPIAADANPEQEFDGEVPFEFICPITNKIMKDPVTASDGYDHERQAIRRWFRRKRTSPVSNEELTDLTFRASYEIAFPSSWANIRRFHNEIERMRVCEILRCIPTRQIETGLRGGPGPNNRYYNI